MLLRFSRVRKIKRGRFPEPPKLCDLEEKLPGLLGLVRALLSQTLMDGYLPAEF